MHFSFTDEIPSSHVDRVIEATLGRRLWIDDEDYPDLGAWGQRLGHELRSGVKTATVAYNRKQVAGSIIGKNSDDPTIYDIRRIAIVPGHEGRGIASFLLRNAEIEAARRYPLVSSFRVDAKITNSAMRDFLQKNGYTLSHVADLYGLGAGLDAVYIKLQPSSRKSCRTNDPSMP